MKKKIKNMSGLGLRAEHIRIRDAPIYQFCRFFSYTCLTPPPPLNYVKKNCRIGKSGHPLVKIQKEDLVSKIVSIIYLAQRPTQMARQYQIPPESHHNIQNILIFYIFQYFIFSFLLYIWHRGPHTTQMAR